MTRKLASVGFSIHIAFWLIAGSASAVQVVGSETAEIAWEPASGPVAAYGVFIAWNGAGFPAAPDQYVMEPRAVIAGGFGQVAVVRVAAFDSTGRQGPLSEASEPIEFVAPPAPSPEVTLNDALYAEDFQDYPAHADPQGWLDTGASNGLGEEPLAFETFVFGDGNVVFGTASEGADLHSHYLTAESAWWDAYEYSGRMRIAHDDGGIGVTILSRYPARDAYYRLGRVAGGDFRLDSHPARAFDCVDTPATGVVPRRDAWYWYRLQAFRAVPGMRLRAKIWHEADAEPVDWPVDCLDASGSALLTGSTGVWSSGPGDKYWDDFEVTGLTPPPTPSDVDHDGWIHSEDNCPFRANPDQLDTDGDGAGDACDAVVVPEPDGLLQLLGGLPLLGWLARRRRRV